MSNIIIVLLILSAGVSAYVRARREGTWSWPLFVKTLLGLWAICAMAAVLIIGLIRLNRPEHALLSTILAVVFIIAGVVVLTRWLNRKKVRNP